LQLILFYIIRNTHFSPFSILLYYFTGIYDFFNLVGRNLKEYNNYSLENYLKKINLKLVSNRKKGGHKMSLNKRFSKFRIDYQCSGSLKIIR